MSFQNIRLDDLPEWMRPRRRVFDWGRWLVVGFCLFICTPLLVRSGLPSGNEAKFYMYRSIEVMKLIHTGTLYSRWAADLNYRLGSPLFNYLAPLPHYAAGYIEALTDIDPATAIKLLMYLSIILAGTGMYQFVRQRWGAPAGIISAGAYIFSTPLTLTLPYIYGDLGLLMAMGLLPWVLFALDHLWRRPKWRNTALTSVLIGLFFLTDTRMVLLGSTTIVASLISLNWRPDTTLKAYRHPLIALACAVLLTAFFWMPAFFERDQIRWIPIANDSQSGAISVLDMFKPMPRYDINALNIIPSPKGIGTGTGLLAIIGVGALFIRVRREQSGTDAVEFLLVGLALIIMAQPSFESLWASPQAFQPVLPYHAVLIATLCFSVMAGHAVKWFSGWKFADYWPAILLLLLIVISIPMLYPPEWSPQQTELDTLAPIQSELNGSHLGTFRSGLLLPASAATLPDPPNGLLDQLKNNTFQMINPRIYSGDSHINTVDQEPLYSKYLVDLYSKDLKQFDVEYYTFNFPGWTSSIDGVEQAVQSSAQGLIKVTVTPQNATSKALEIVVWLQGTPIRNLAWTLTWLGVIAVLFIQRRRVNTPWTASKAIAKTTSQTIISLSQQLLTFTQSSTILCILCVAFMATLAISYVPELLLSNSRFDKTPDIHFLPKDVFSAQPITAAAYRISVDSGPLNSVQPGATLYVSLYWQANTVQQKNFQSELQLVSLPNVAMPGAPRSIAWLAHQAPGNIPIIYWLRGHYVQDDFEVKLPSDVASGDYLLQAKLMQCQLPRLAICDNSNLIGTDSKSDPVGSINGIVVSLGTIHIVPSSQP